MLGSGYVSRVCFAGMFRGMFRGIIRGYVSGHVTRHVSQVCNPGALLKPEPPQKNKPILELFEFRVVPEFCGFELFRDSEVEGVLYSGHRVRGGTRASGLGRTPSILQAEKSACLRWLL